MRDQQVPDDGLEGLTMRGDRVGIDRRHDDAGIGDLRRVAAVATDDANDRGAELLGRTAGPERGSG